MSFWNRYKSKWTFTCNQCGKSIKPGESMSIVTHAPMKSYNGAMIPLINKFVKDTNGTIYCGECFNQTFHEE